MFGIRTTLRIGATVFGLSAVLLIVVPAFFLNLLGLNGADAPLVWSMRMIGITLVALAGNMWANASQASNAVVRRVGMVMAVAASSLGLLTLLIPTDLTWFAYLYSAVGFAFGLNYIACLMRRLS